MLFSRIKRVPVLIALLASTLSSCTTVPPLSGPANVPLAAIVNRIKCDLMRITAQKINQTPEYAFLKEWSIKAHMTLAVDNTSSFNPGATIIQPLPSAMPLGGTIGAVSQSFSTGLGAGLSGEAVATTDLEFFLSFKEIENDLHRAPELGSCVNHNGVLLDSDLQLDSLFDNALEPVRLHLLVPGNHPGIAGSSPAQPSRKAIAGYEANLADLLRNVPNETQPVFLSSLIAARFQLLQKELDSKNKPSQAVLDLPAIEERKIREFHREARQKEIGAQAIVKNVVEPIGQIISNSFPACAEIVGQLKDKAAIEAAVISSQKINVDETKDQNKLYTKIQPLQRKFEELISTSREVMRLLKSCKARPEPKTSSAIYDPIDLISQTINFYIVASGTISPSWKLVRVTAPIAPALVTLNRRYTDTLVIAFGRPEPGKPVSTAISNQILTATLRDALSGFQPR